MIIEGKKISEKILEELKKLPKPKKFFGAVLVNSDASSISFLKQKEKVAKELEIDFRLYKFPLEIKQDELRKEILKIALHKTSGGVIVQLPLPKHINPQYVLNVIPREKDIDVLGERALGAFYASRNIIFPPAVGVVDAIFKTYNLKLTNLKVAVVGLGFLVGKPISHWLMGKCPEIYLLDKGSDLKILKEVDVVISGVGKANLIKPEMLKNNALVIDFGYSLENGKIKGDFEATQIPASNFQLPNSKFQIPNFSYTPTPGGTGPILVAKIFENFYKLNS